MKKILLYSLVLVMTSFLMSCDKDSEGLSHISPSPSFELIGNSVELVQLGESYSDAGVTVTETLDGETTELTDVTVYTSLDTSLPGSYTVSYSVKNSLGDVFYSDVQRTVVVFNDDITGVYEASVSRDGRVMDMVADILIVKVGANRYTISDWIGGWYDQYYGYGSRYAFAGTMEIDSDNNLIHKSHSDPWGYDGSFSESPTAEYDPVEGTFHYVYVWTAGYTFDVTLTKK